MNMPIMTPHLLEDVFHSYTPGGTGLEFGRGLSPFAVVCQGHSETKEIERLTRDASLVESGTSTSLSEA